jgi:type IV pilus biogenesis protein CpaD/CtpE
MTITIIEDQCEAAATQARIVVEGGDPNEVTATATKRAVLEKATELGISRAGISGNGGAYPVDAEGNTIDLEGLRAGGLPDGVKYRNDYTVSSGL